MIKLDFDQESWALIDRISNSIGVWEDLMYEKTAEELAEVAKEYMKPLMHVRPTAKNTAEESLRHSVNYTGNGYEINFYSLFYANFVDEGSPFDKLYAYNYGKKAFPIDKRFGTPIFRGSISGVGKGNSPYASQLPTHFSKRTAEYLAESKANEIMLKNMMEWIDWAVNVV